MSEVAQPVEIPFWNIREGFIARECLRCGHRGVFEISENPVMVSDNIICLACGTVTFKLITEDLTGETVKDLVEAARPDDSQS